MAPPGGPSLPPALPLASAVRRVPCPPRLRQETAPARFGSAANTVRGAVKHPQPGLGEPRSASRGGGCEARPAARLGPPPQTHPGKPCPTPHPMAVGHHGVPAPVPENAAQRVPNSGLFTGRRYTAQPARAGTHRPPPSATNPPRHRRGPHRAFGRLPVLGHGRAPRPR